MSSNFDKYFETLSATYLKLIDEKYVNPEKVLQIIKTLKLPTIKAQTIVLTAMRDATRHTSLQLYGNSNKKRQDILNAIMGAIEKLEKPPETKPKTSLHSPPATAPHVPKKLVLPKRPSLSKKPPFKKPPPKKETP